MKEKIIASVVLYHPDKSLMRNIGSYIDFVDEIVVVDNSDVEDPWFKAAFATFDKIRYIHNQGNLGIAKALNIAAEYAISKGYKWILTMDQDSSFEESAAADYIEHFNRSDKEHLAILSPFQLDVNHQEDDDAIQLVMTSANLLNLQRYKEIGGFNDDLFIDEVDHDYCLRAIGNGYVIKRVNIKINHSLGKHKMIRAFGKKLVVSVHSPLRVYYITRNNLYMFRTYGQQFPELMKARKLMLYRVLLNNLVFDLPSFFKKSAYIYKAARDFRKNKFGKYEG
jgi:rhamnosyltransferase